MAPNLITREPNVDDVSSENSVPEEPKKVPRPRPHHQLPTIVIVSQDTAYDQLLPRQSLYLDYPYHCTQQHYWRSKKATFLFSVVILVVLALFCITIIATTNIVKQVKESNDDLALIVKTTCGPVNGECDGKNFVFRGIPYAVPPMGSQRWNQPIPNIVSSSGQCHQKGQAGGGGGGRGGAASSSILCTQRNFRNGEIIGQENCLYLNIWLPRQSLKETTSKILPVVVVMQGEGQDFGGSEEGGDNFGGKQFQLLRQLKSKGDAVLVSVNYRLGVFGFLAMDSDEENTTSTKISGNYGLMDQILALQWIKENIEYFNGDPNSVVVYGESSGTETMSGLLRSPKSRNLFQGLLAIDPASLPIRPLDDVKDLNDEALSQTTCQKDIECLRKLDGSELLESFAVSEPVNEIPLDGELRQYLHPHNHHHLNNKNNQQQYHHHQNLALAIDEITLFPDDESELSNPLLPTVPVFIGQVCRPFCGTGKDKTNILAKHIGQMFKLKPKTLKEAMKLYTQHNTKASSNTKTSSNTKASSNTKTGSNTKSNANIVSEMASDIKMCRTEKLLQNAKVPLYYLVSLPRTLQTAHSCSNNNNNNNKGKPSWSFLCSSSNNLHRELSTRKPMTSGDEGADLSLLWSDIFVTITKRSPLAQLVPKDEDRVVSVTPNSQKGVCHFWDQHTNLFF